MKTLQRPTFTMVVMAIALASLLGLPGTITAETALFDQYFVEDCSPAFPNIRPSDSAWVGFLGSMSSAVNNKTVGGFATEITAGPTLDAIVFDVLFGSGYAEVNDVAAVYDLPQGLLFETHDARLVRSPESSVCAPGFAVMIATADGTFDGVGSTQLYAGASGETRLYCEIEVGPPGSNAAFYRTCSFLFRFDELQED